MDAPAAKDGTALAVVAVVSDRARRVETVLLSSSISIKVAVTRTLYLVRRVSPVICALV